MKCCDGKYIDTGWVRACVCDVFAIYDNNISPTLLMIIIKIIILYFIQFQIRHTDNFPPTGTPASLYKCHNPEDLFHTELAQPWRCAITLREKTQTYLTNILWQIIANVETPTGNYPNKNAWFNSVHYSQRHACVITRAAAKQNGTREIVRDTTVKNIV